VGGLGDGTVAGQIRITLKRSVIGFPRDQRHTARSLGLTRIRRSAVHQDTPQVRGMVNKIRHLVEVEAIAAGEKPAAKARREGAEEADSSLGSE
jgi:large subunit ribosomal protein L30